MKNNEFRQAVAILYPHTEFNFEAGETMYAAHDGYGMSLRASKDSDFINIYHNGINTGVHDADVVIAENEPTDPFTAEQNQLEQVRAIYKSLKVSTMPVSNGSEYLKGFSDGMNAQHKAILLLLEGVFGDN